MAYISSEGSRYFSWNCGYRATVGNPTQDSRQSGGSKYPIFTDSGPKCHLGDGFWDQRP